MDYALILARMIHVVMGVLWVGSIWFISVFLAPSLGEVGPDAGKVMAALTRRKFMIYVPIIAVLTMLSGFYLYWRVSLGFSPDYMGSSTGKTLGTGAVLAILAFIVGLSVTRPAMIKATKLGAQAATASPAERDALMKEAQALRDRSASWSKIVLLLLIGAVIAMSIARYV